MDIFMPIAICIILIILFAICGWCCKAKRDGTVYGYGPTVTVSSQPVQASPVVVPPYPIDPRHPTPASSGAPAPGFATHSAPYPTHNTNMPQPQSEPVRSTTVHSTYQPAPGFIYASHPMHMPLPHTGMSPYPPAGGAPPYPQSTPYPPGDYNIHPPPYDVAVSSPPVQPPPVKEAYGKQAPYNPNFS